MYLDKKTEKKWLVKSDNNIIGPYSIEQITDLIRKKQVSIIDEVRDPETRWLYIRENGEFKKVVEQIRIELDSKQESTRTIQSQFRSEDSLNRTLPQTEIELTQTQTATSTALGSEASKILTDIKLEIENFDVDVKSSIPLRPVDRDNRIYKTETVYESQDSNGGSGLMLKVLSGLVALGLISGGGYFYYNFQQQKTVQKADDSNIINVKKYKHIGDFDRLVQSFSELKRNLQQKMVPELLDVYPLLQKKNLLTYEDVLKAKTADLTSLQKSQIEIIDFLKLMQQKKYNEAEDKIVKAISLQPTSLVAKENSAILSYFKDKYKDSFDMFGKLFKEEKNGRYLMGSCMAFSKMPAAEQDMLKESLLAQLQNYTASYFDFKKELLVFQLYIAHVTANESAFKLALEDFLNTPPHMANYFLQPSLLVENFYKLGATDFWLPIFDKIIPEDDKLLFKTHLYVENGQLAKANEVFNAESAEQKNELNKQQAQLFLLAASDQIEKILEFEKASKINLKNSLNRFILAMSKVNSGQAASSSKADLDFLESQNQFFYKNWAVAQGLLMNPNTEEIKGFVKDRFITNSNFVPYIKLKGSVN